MKGKHGVVAAARRDWQAVERERDEALLRAQRAEKLLAEVVERNRVSSEAAQRTLSALREAASTAVAPVVVDLRGKLESMRRYATALEKQIELQAEHWARFEIRLTRALANELDVAGIVANAFVRGGYLGGGEFMESEGQEDAAPSLAEVKEKFKGLHARGELSAPGRMKSGGAFAKWRERDIKDDYREEARRRIAEAHAGANPIELGPLTQDVAIAAAGEDAA